MRSLIAEAAALQIFVEENRWEFFFIGGLAVQFWGQPRLTDDIDLTVFTNLSDELTFISKFLERYRPKFSDAEKFALTNRVLPMYSDEGLGIDLVLGGLTNLSQPLERATYREYTSDIQLRICSAEDLIIYKTIAGRTRDWVDIESVIIKQSTLDWEYIDSSLESLTVYDDLTEKLIKLGALKTQYYKK